jgi:hypothetical protein
MEFLNNKKKENALGQLIRIAILSWSAALLTASYAGMLYLRWIQPLLQLCSQHLLLPLVSIL